MPATFQPKNPATNFGISLRGEGRCLHARPFSGAGGWGRPRIANPGQVGVEIALAMRPAHCITVAEIQRSVRTVIMVNDGH